MFLAWPAVIQTSRYSPAGKTAINGSSGFSEVHIAQGSGHISRRNLAPVH
jgi:hypothetical protein